MLAEAVALRAGGALGISRKPDNGGDKARARTHARTPWPDNGGDKARTHTLAARTHAPKQGQGVRTNPHTRASPPPHLS